MEIIIKDNSFDINSLKLKSGKQNIKLLYEIYKIKVIGICLEIKDIQESDLVEKEKIEIRNKKQIDIFKSIDSYLSLNLKDYVSFFKNNMIFIRNKNIREGKLYVNINNIKLSKGKHYVNIFSL